VGEHLPSKSEALSSDPRVAKRRKGGRKGRKKVGSKRIKYSGHLSYPTAVSQISPALMA
jgi:hypothetical protein